MKLNGCIKINPGLSIMMPSLHLVVNDPTSSLEFLVNDPTPSLEFLVNDPTPSLPLEGRETLCLPVKK
jgi:hypothetical protein